ncbi:MAG TPA: hypothetical protein VGK17_10475 [Propionicimonas sp.]|jgi:hypothetical protein
MMYRKSLAIALLTIAALAVPTAANAVSTPPAGASPARVAETAAPSADTVTIEIPMQVVPTKSSNGGVTPNIVIPGDCGTAFLYTSRTGTGQAHIDFGFANLTTPAVYVSGHVGMVNLDNAGTAYQSWGGPTWGTRNWEKQTNLTASPQYGGEYQVTGYIHVTGALYDCTSSPALWEDIYLW